MYIPKHFEIQDEESIYNVIEDNSFATLVSQTNGIPYASHLPLILDRDMKLLYGHFAKPNAQWNEIKDQEVLAIFHGPHSYISPSWYETDTAVPTWNYVAVHVYGKVELVENEKELFDSLREMVGKYEKPNSSYKFNEVDSSYLTGLSKGIVGFKMRISRMEGKAKLSQNHPIERQQLILEQLGKMQNEDSNQIAQLMKDNIR